MNILHAHNDPQSIGHLRSVIAKANGTLGSIQAVDLGAALDYIGITTVVVLVLYAVYKLIRACHAAASNSPQWRDWWQKNGENATIDATAWCVGLIMAGTTIAWRDVVNANLYGIAALNTGVALLVRASVPTLWVWTIWMSWRLQSKEDASEPMEKIRANKIVPALNRGIIAATVISTLLAGNEVRPEWIGEWWVLVIATTFGCNWTTKIESTYQPMSLWHRLTKNKYREHE